MSPSKFGIAVLVFLVLASCSAAPSQQGAPLALPLSDLKAPDWLQRRAAYMKITVSEETLQRPDVKTALVDLLESENQLIRKTLVDSNGEIGVSGKYGEDYSEYYATLLGTVEKIVDWHDPHQACILAQGSYNPGSRFAAALAAKGGATVAPCLLRMAESNFMFDRHESIPVLVQLSAVANDLSPSVQQQVSETVRRGLRDSNVGVRLVTVQAVREFGTPEMIPLLQEIARSDPYSRRLDNGQQRFSVRDAAAQAIQSIQQRAQAR